MTKHTLRKVALGISPLGGINYLTPLLASEFRYIGPKVYDCHSFSCSYEKGTEMSIEIFSDTSVERNTLMERVYPRLKSFCQERGYDFQVVDMRWGVRDESTDDHMTTELCMRELRACQKLSTGPNFIVRST